MRLILAVIAALLFATPVARADTALTGPCTPANTTIIWASPQAGESWNGEASGVTMDGDDWTLRRCEITLDPAAWGKLNRAEKCSLVLHEFGHLYLQRHTESGVMAPTDARWVPFCNTIRERVKHDLMVGLQPDDGVICGKGARVFYCRTFTIGADGWQRERRYRVRVTGQSYAIRRVKLH